MSNKHIVRITDIVARNGDEDGPEVKISCRGLDGAKYNYRIDGTRPYMFVPKDEVVPGGDAIEEVNTGYEGYDGIPLQQIVTTNPSNVGELQEDYDVRYEDDIPYPRRVSVDYGLTGYIRIPEIKDRVHIDEVETGISVGTDGIEPRVMMADIETIAPSGGNFDDFVENAPNKVIMITSYDTYEDEYYVLCLDPDDKVDTSDVRQGLVEHWSSHPDFDKYVESDIRYRGCETEAELLQAFISEVNQKRPDVLSGWNWVDFDHRYLINRMDQVGSINEHDLAEIGYIQSWNPDKARQWIDGLPGFDMMEAYCDKMTLGDFRSSALDYIADLELDVGKMENISINECYEEDRSKLLAYNIIDTQLLVGMDDKHGIHEFFYQMADLCGVPIYDTFSEMRMVEGFLLKHREDNEILPTTKDLDMDTISGGLVLNPSQGLREWVGVLDLKSLYPSSIISANISKETLTWDEEEADVVIPDMPLNADEVPGSEITENDIDWSLDGGIGIDMSGQGLLAKYIQLLFTERKDRKKKRDQFKTSTDEYEVWDNKQYAVKVLMNSFFGVSDNPHFRLARQGMGDAITGVSRYVTWKGVQIAEEMGYEVAYGDTDSIFIELAEPNETVEDDGVVNRGEILEEAINNEMGRVAEDLGLPDEHPFMADDLHGTKQHCWAWEFEKLYRRFLQTGSKKRYAGLKVWDEGQYLDDPKLDVTGYEAKRSNVPEIGSEVQEEILERVLNGEKFVEVSEYLQGVVQGVQEGEIELRKIGIPGVLNKHPREYPNRPVPRACMYANQHLEDISWGEGDEPWVFYIKSTPTMQPGSDVIAVPWHLDELPEGYELDATEHIQKFIKQPLEPILDEMGWDFKELKTGKRSQSAVEITGGGSDPFAGQEDEEEDIPKDPFT